MSRSIIHLLAGLEVELKDGRKLTGLFGKELEREVKMAAMFVETSVMFHDTCKAGGGTKR